MSFDAMFPSERGSLPGEQARWEIWSGRDWRAMEDVVCSPTCRTITSELHRIYAAGGAAVDTTPPASDPFIYKIVKRIVDLGVAPPAPSAGGNKRAAIINKNSYDRAVKMGNALREALLSHGGTFESVMRFVRDAPDIGAVVLMWYADRIRSRARGGSCDHAREANELDIALQLVAAGGLAASADAAAAIIKLRTVYPFRALSVVMANPSIIFRGSFDQFLPARPIKPRTNQIETITAFLGLINPVTRGWIINMASPGAGKTTLSAIVASLALRQLRDFRARGNGGAFRIIVVPGSGGGQDSVFMSMYRHCGLEIPFAYVGFRAGECGTGYNHQKRNTIHISCQRANTNANDHVFIAHDAEAAYQLMLAEPGKYVVFFDEMPFMSEMVGTHHCRNNMRVAALATVLVSLCATHPPASCLPSIVDHFGGNVTTVMGGVDNIQINCEIRDFSGAAVMPHDTCLTCEDFLRVSELVKTSSIVARIYSAPLLIAMSLAALSEDPRAPDLRLHFDDVANLNPAAVAAAAAGFLRWVSSADEKVRTAVAAVTLPPVAPLDIARLADSGILPGQSMVADLDPVALALDIYSGHLEGYKAAGGDSAEGLWGKYTARCASVAAARAAAEEKTAHRRPIAGGGSASDARSVAADSIAAAKFPHVPAWFQLGTAEHRARVSRPLSDCRHPLSLAAVGYYPGVPDDISLLLFAGVGIISERLSYDYLQAVWRQASEGKLSVVFTDITGMFAANIPLTNIIVTPRVVGSKGIASSNTLIQAVGRLCRQGVSYEGRAYVDAGAARSLFAPPSWPEATNMEYEFNRALEFIRDFDPKSADVRRRGRTRDRERDKELTAEFTGMALDSDSGDETNKVVGKAPPAKEAPRPVTKVAYTLATSAVVASAPVEPPPDNWDD